MGFNQYTIEELETMVGDTQSGENPLNDMDEITSPFNQESSGGIGLPAPIKSYLTGIATIPAAKLRGLTVYTPGDSFLDDMLRKASESLGDVVPEQWKRDVAEDQRLEELSDLKDVRFWSSVMGSQAALYTDLFVSKKLGKAVGGLIGVAPAVTGAAIPDPATTVAGISAAFTAANISEAMVGIGSMGLMMAGTFMAEAEMAGYDRDAAENKVRAIAMLAGAVEYAQYLGAVGPIKRAGGKIRGTVKGTMGQVISKIPKTGRGPLLWAAKELGIDLSEGAEEVVQGILMQRAWSSATKEMKRRYGEDWKPYHPVGGSNPLMEGIVGTGIAAITRGSGYGLSIASAPTRHYLTQKNVHRKIGKDLLRKVEDGTASFEDIAKRLGPEPEARLAPYEFKERQQRKAAGLTDAEKIYLIDMFAATDGGKQQLRRLADNMGLDPQVRKKVVPDLLNDPGIYDMVINKGLGISNLAIALGHTTKGNDSLILQLKALSKKADDAFTAFNEAVKAGTESDIAEHQRLSLVGASYHEALHVIDPSTDMQLPVSQTEATQYLQDFDAKNKTDVSNRIVAKSAIVRPKTFKERIAEVREKLNLAEEGPTIVEGEVKLRPPTINKPTEGDIKWVTKLENAARKAVTLMVGNDIKNEQKGRETAGEELMTQEEINKKLRDDVEENMHDIRKISMQDSGMAEMISEDPRINPPSEIGRREASQQTRLNNMSTRQLASYGLSLESNARRSIKKLLGKRAVAEFDAAVYTTYDPPLVTNEAGEEISIEDAQGFPPFSALLSQIRPFLPHIMKIQNRTGLPILKFYRTMMTQLRRKTIVDNQLWIARSEAYKRIKGRLIRGKRRRLLEDIAQIMTLDGTNHVKLFNQELGMSEDSSIDEYIDRYMREADFTDIRDKKSGKVTKDEVRAAAAQLAQAHRGFYNWFFRETGLEWVRYLDQYLPLVRTFKGMEREISFGQWIREQHNQNNLDESLTENDIEKFIEFGDTAAYLQESGYKFLEGTPFYEFVREQDDTLLKEQASIETSLSRQMDIYQSKLTRNVFFGHLVPFINSMTINMSRELKKEGIDPNEIKGLLGDLTESILGIPGRTTSALKRANLTSSRTVIGNLLKESIQWWNKTYAGTWRELPEVYTANELVHSLMTYFYATTLGVGPQRSSFGLLSPLKNIMTQSVFASIIGQSTYIQGIARLSHPEVVKYLEEMHLRLEFPIVEEFDMSARGTLRKTAEFFLHVFKYSDHCNVMVAGSGALVAWERLEKLVQNTPGGELTIDNVSRVLFEGVNPDTLNINQNDLLDGSPITMEKWNYTRKQGFKGISQEMFDMIQNKEMDSAKDFFIRTMVALSQWQYGKGGSPHALRSSITRFFFMYSTWWMNYGEFVTWVGTPKNGLWLRGLAMLLAQWAIVSVLSGLGLESYNWIGMGPFPEEIGFTGPGVQILNQALSVVKGAGEAGQASITPGVSSEQKREVKERFKRRFEDLQEEFTF